MTLVTLETGLKNLSYPLENKSKPIMTRSHTFSRFQYAIFFSSPNYRSLAVNQKYFLYFMLSSLPPSGG